MVIDFTGQVVLVTGATRGIGKQLAEDFAALGAKLILTGRQQPQLEAIRATPGGSESKETDWHCVDFSEQESTHRFLDQLGCYEKIDVCINNAGMNRINYLDETRVEDWDEILDVNLKAPFLITRVVSRIMKIHHYGRIVNISSVFGVISREKRSIYSASKFGLRGLTVAASNELARYNVLVNAVSPGFVLTDLTKRILREHEIAELVSQIPAERLATPEDISRVILFLTSSLNTYITGQNIIVDGGFVNV